MKTEGSHQQESGERLAVASVTDALRRRGLRLTPQREAIVRALSEGPGHPTVEEIYRRVREEFPMISLNTVYQTVDTLSAVGVITPLRNTEAIRYDTNREVHHHAVCMRCQKILDVSDPSVTPIPPPGSLRGKFQVVESRVEFLGYCTQCRGRASLRPAPARAGSRKQRR